MRAEKKIWTIAACALAAGALVLAFLSLLSPSSGDTAPAAKILSRNIEKRLKTLDRAVETAFESQDGTWTSLKGLPEDMVVYRYVDDTLQSWAGQFPIRSDDVFARSLVPRMGEGRSSVYSPLAETPQEWTFVNHGSKWYIQKCEIRGNVRVISGLEVVNELRPGSMNGVSRILLRDDRYGVKPLSAEVGSEVMVRGVPLFKLTSEQSGIQAGGSPLLLMLAAILLALSLLAAVAAGLRLWIAIPVQFAAFAWLYVRGRAAGLIGPIFSPLLYADGPVLYSLWPLLLINAFVVLLVADIYAGRLKGKVNPWVVASACLAIALLLHVLFRSVIVNSDICLELYKTGRLSAFTAIVYVSFIGLALCIPALIALVTPFRLWMKVAFASLAGIYFVAVSTPLGFRKEEQRVNVIANRLAMDRDMSLELQLRQIEGAIEQDRVFGALAAAEGGADVIRGRLTDNYMSRISQNYDITVLQAGTTPAGSALFQERIRSGMQLWEGSHFFYSPIGNGRVAYTGFFTWYNPGVGPSGMLISIESKFNREDRGYLSLIGIQDPGRMSIPGIYSFAKYVDGRLSRYGGAYSYPTVFEGALPGKDWYHFVQHTSDQEVVVISRKSFGPMEYAVAGLILAIAIFLLLVLLFPKKREAGYSSYYQNRLSLVIYISLFLALVSMAAISIWFVYRRNNADLENILTSRVNTLQGMCQEKLRQTGDISSAETAAVLDDIGSSLHCDIALFDPSGRVVFSTTPEVYERRILGHRLNEQAYYNIVHAHMRFFIMKEKVGRRAFYSMYAPLFSSDGRMKAILSSPFTDITRETEAASVRLVATVVVFFFLLLFLARIFSGMVISRLFRPILELSRRMKETDIDHLEPLSYDGDDEITPLVEAYNRMVEDLSESTLRLAQAERDKAWTDMARRVAHDLKNPLTPIKLQLQMLIRMKTSGNPAWEDRFDDVAKTVLYHVDLLADSADQFSTFARMYEQKSEEIDLDVLVGEEVALFNSRDDVSIEYYGLPGSRIVGPRPQLTRVVVNLLTNAMQAVEENGGDARILVSLRNSTRDGFYEIVVEDNGPGVEQSNQEKIFTPDFTTKTSGSGLGLAICRRIAEHCGGSISYSRSFSLGGAAFTVLIPKI